MKRFFGFVVVCLMFGTTASFAEMPREKGGLGPDKEMKHKEGKKGEDVSNIERYIKFKEELNLTDEQIKTLEKIRLDYKRDAIKQQAEIKLARLDLREILRSDKPDFSAARSKIKQISTLQLESKLAMIDVREKGYNVLSSEQQKRFLQFKKERKQKWMKERQGKRNK